MQTTGLLTSRQFAELLGVNRYTLARWRQRHLGGPDFIRLSPRLIRYSRFAVEAWMREMQESGNWHKRLKSARTRQSRIEQGHYTGNVGPRNQVRKYATPSSSVSSPPLPEIPPTDPPAE